MIYKIIGNLPRNIKKFKGQNKPKPEPLPTKFTFVTKSKIFKTNPKHTRFHAEPIAKRDMASSLARRTEERSHRALTKKVESAYKRTIAKPQKANQFAALVKQKQRALTRAFTLSQKRGYSTLKKSSKKLNIGIKKFNPKDPGGHYSKDYGTFLSANEAKQLGFPPKEISSEMKAFYDKGKPLSKAKQARKTLSTIYSKPKSWKKRSSLIKHYKGVARTELKQAKVDRAIFRGTTVQKQTGEYTAWTKSGFVSKPKPVTRKRYKTIYSPERSYDVHTKRWK
jgi:hypothetical protein|tara:strand:+ start:41 stop:883 length:843 start_codon:yes stop_codon:yes gene_type:complete